MEKAAIEESPLMDITVEYAGVGQPTDTHVVKVTALTRAPLVRRYTDAFSYGYEKVFKEGEPIGKLGLPLSIISSTPSLIGRSPLPAVPFPRLDGDHEDPEMDELEGITEGMKHTSASDKMDEEKGMDGIQTQSGPNKRGINQTPGATAAMKRG